MKYFTIEKDINLDEDKDSFFEGSIIDADLNELVNDMFRMGGEGEKRKLSEPLSLQVIESESIYGEYHEVLPVITSIGNILLYKEDLKNEILKVCQEDIEFFQIKILGKKVDRSDYYAMFVANRLDCIDTENSIFKKRVKRMSKFQKLVFDESKIPEDINIFKVDKTYATFPTIISESIMTIFKDRNVGCIKITPIEDFKQKF